MTKKINSLIIKVTRNSGGLKVYVKASKKIAGFFATGADTQSDSSRWLLADGKPSRYNSDPTLDSKLRNFSWSYGNGAVAERIDNVAVLRAVGIEHGVTFTSTARVTKAQLTDWAKNVAEVVKYIQTEYIKPIKIEVTVSQN